MWSTRRIVLLLLCAFALAAARAQSIVAEAMPDPRIAGFRFPEREADLAQAAAALTRGATVEARQQAAELIRRHAWGLWTALTAESMQWFGGQRLRVFETWRTSEELAGDGPGSTDAVSGARGAVHRRSILRPLNQLPLRKAEPDIAEPLTGRVVGTVKYDPVAAAHIARQGLLHRATLDTLLAIGEQQVTPFPSDAVVVKPVYQVIHYSALVDGRYFLLKSWEGPPVTAQPWGPARWAAGVWIDLLGGGTGSGAVDWQPAIDGSTRTDDTTYPVDALMHYRLTMDDALALDAAHPGSAAGAGDIALLVAMHVSTREVARWTWQTFWWTPSADAPPAPSSADNAAARPRQLAGAARNYALAFAYSMVSPDQPYLGGENAGTAIYAYNPWLEAGFGPADLPDSQSGLDPLGQAAANNCGVQSNCMSCHAQANYNPQSLATAPRFTGARYVDLGAAEFVGTLQMDFLWSLARESR